MTLNKQPSLDEILLVHLHEIKAGHDSKLKAQIEKLLQSARIEENQKYLDRINNYTPDPNAPSFGSASGAMETQGWKNAFEDRIKELKAHLTNKEKDE